MTTSITGELEIDHDRGVIYFHTDHPDIARRYGSVTILRICQLPRPIPQGKAMDITFMHGASYESTTVPKVESPR